MTEAIRGEGGLLLDDDGQRFVDELAPRDEVSRAIDALLAASGGRCVWLDMREVDPALFPNIVESLAEARPRRDVRACAGRAGRALHGRRIVADLEGRSSLPGLFAVGESSCTGLHGANRLASNSLSECFVWGARAARATVAEPARGRAQPEPSRHRASPVDGATKAALWELAGCVEAPRALSACSRIRTRSPAQSRAARLPAPRPAGALPHDHPQTDPELDARHTVLDAGGAPRLELWS